MDADEGAAAARCPASGKQPERLSTPAGRRLDELTPTLEGGRVLGRCPSCEGWR